MPVRPRVRVIGVGAILGAALLLFLTRMLWLPLLGTYLVVADPLPGEPADLVLPLAGDLERVFYAAALYRDRRAEGVLITNLPLATQGAKDEHLQQVYTILSGAGVPEALVSTLPEVSETTFEELEKVRAYLESTEIDSLLVVTSPWHTRRARLNLRVAFRDSKIQASIAPLPSYAAAPNLPRSYNPRTWWQNADTFKKVTSEYLKLAAYAIGVR